MAADGVFIESDADGIPIDFTIPVEDAIGSGGRMIEAGDEGDIVFDILRFAIADIAEHGKDGQIVGFHSRQEFLGSEHVGLVFAGADDSAVHVRIAGEPARRLYAGWGRMRYLECKIMKSGGTKCGEPLGEEAAARNAFAGAGHYNR